jgi:hypothetical protein
MRSGWSLAIAAICVLVVALGMSGGEVPLRVNGDAVSLIYPLLQEADHWLVPLREFGLRLGVEAAYIEEENSICVRWDDGKVFFPTDYFPLYGGIYYIPLDELIDIVGAKLHTIGDEIYIETDLQNLISLEATADRVIARFDGFVPYETIEMGSGTIHLRFYHCALATVLRQVALTGGAITSATLGISTDQSIDLIIEISSASLPQTKRFETPGFYSVSLTFDHQPLVEAEVEILPHVTYHEIETDLGEGLVKINYLYVENWREHYRLVPTTSEGGLGTLSSLKEMALSHGARAAINANFFDPATGIPIGLLIINGQALNSNYARRAALGIDLFGRLTFFNPAASLYLRAGEERIPLDDVNRSIKADELVAYTVGYPGPITRGSSQAFRTVKVRNNRVTAIQDGPYVVEDRSADLLVACGAARDRIVTLRIGDEVSIEYTLDEGDLLITDVVSAGPLLVASGQDVLDPEAENFQIGSYLVSSLAARSVLATDWHGGLILLTVTKNSGSVGTNFEGLLSILHRLPMKVKDAIAFDGGHSSSLVFKDGATYREIGSGGKVAVGLLLVPTDR